MGPAIATAAVDDIVELDGIRVSRWRVKGVTVTNKVEEKR
jgi:hypothetical protein